MWCRRPACPNMQAGRLHHKAKIAQVIDARALSRVQGKRTPAQLSPAAESNAESAKANENSASSPASLFSGATLPYSLGAEGVFLRKYAGFRPRFPAEQNNPPSPRVTVVPIIAKSGRTRPPPHKKTLPAPQCMTYGSLESSQLRLVRSPRSSNLELLRREHSWVS